MKAHASASAGKKSSGSKKFSHMIVKPAENGFMAEHHFERPKASREMPYPDSPEPETHVMSTPEELGSHVSKQFGGKETSAPAAGVGKAGKSAPKNSKPAAAPDAEPDADDED